MENPREDRALAIARKIYNDDPKAVQALPNSRDVIHYVGMDKVAKRTSGTIALSKVAALIAENIDEVYPLTSSNFIFLYDPSTDMMYIASTSKFHIDLINYIVGQKKHTNPDDSYSFMDQYVLGVYYDVPEFHQYPKTEAITKRVIELGEQVKQLKDGGWEDPY